MIESPFEAPEKPAYLQLPPEEPIAKLTGKKRDELHSLYREMLLIRRFEEACAKAYAGGKIGGFCHLYIGQEAVGVGSIHSLQPKDYVVSTYRDHGHAISRGIAPKALMAELFGRETGCSGGKGGSMHFFDKKTNFMGGHGIVGGHLALAAGIGWAIKYRKENAACICFFGDGAANIGTFHEALNLAAVWKLPVVFICENNQYSMGTPLYRSMSVNDVSLRGPGYNMAHDSIPGEDVMRVKERVSEHVERARRGEGPTLIDISTYRYRGHSMSDPAKYRTKEEVETYKKRDPLIRAHNTLLASGAAESDLSSLEAEVKALVQEAVDFAEKSPVPSLSSLYSDVYV